LTRGSFEVADAAWLRSDGDVGSGRARGGFLLLRNSRACGGGSLSIVYVGRMLLLL